MTAGAYRLRQCDKPVVTLAAMDDPTWILDQVFPVERATPLVTVLDGHPHTLAFLSTIRNVPVSTLGVTRFGQSGAIEDVCRYHGIDTDSLVATALDLID